MRIQAPASAAHLGPGYAVLSVALRVPLEVRVLERTEPGHVVERPSHPESGLDPRHDPFLRGLHLVAERSKAKVPAALTIRIEHEPPSGAGVGSSTALYAAGIVAGMRFARRTTSLDEALNLLVELGGDPAHGASALAGGLASACLVSPPSTRPQQYRVLRHPLHAGWRFVLALPVYAVGLADTRRLIPATLPHSVTQRTTSRLLGLLRALADGDEALLRTSMLDEVHVPFRRRLVPGMDEAIHAAHAAGAAGATISGHGPGIVALTRRAEVSEAIGKAMAQAFATHGVTTNLLTTQASEAGTVAI